MGLSDTRSRLVARLHRRKTRQREGLVLVEGPNAVGELLSGGTPLRFAIVSDRFDPAGGGEILGALVERLPRGPEDLHRVSDAVLAELADTETPQGLLVVAEEPDLRHLLAGSAPLEGRWLVLDAVQDPGNVGTLIRAAAAFGCAGAVALDGTSDPWGTRAVRASAGTVFRMPVLDPGRAGREPLLDRLPRPRLVADATGAPPAGRGGAQWSLVVGNEGSGVRPEVRERCDEVVAIPMPGGVESLNAGVAGAILLYALTPGVGAPPPLGASPASPTPRSP